MSEIGRSGLPPGLERVLFESLGIEGMPPPPPELLAKILERIAAEPGARWHPVLPGVEFRTLVDDGRTRTWLARMERGASLPAHDHPGDEECVVVQGKVMLDAELVGAGEYRIARAGTRHEMVHSPGGCVLLLRSPSPLAA